MKPCWIAPDHIKDWLRIETIANIECHKQTLAYGFFESLYLLCVAKGFRRHMSIRTRTPSCSNSAFWYWCWNLESSIFQNSRDCFPFRQSSITAKELIPACRFYHNLRGREQVSVIHVTVGVKIKHLCRFGWIGINFLFNIYSRNDTSNTFAMKFSKIFPVWFSSISTGFLFAQSTDSIRSAGPLLQKSQKKKNILIDVKLHVKIGKGIVESENLDFLWMNSFMRKLNTLK